MSLSAVSFIYFLIKELKEIKTLKWLLKKILGKNTIASKEDLIQIKNYLHKNIKYDALKKEQKRPLLRHTASYIISTNYGFCGENARVAIKLFLLGGLKARRIYLFRKEWQHVLIEHSFNGKWYMFDGHYDPETVLKDEQVASIASENIAEYPDNYPNNPYLDFCRIKMLRSIKALRSFSKAKLPMFVVYISESPYSIKALLSFMGMIVAGLLLFI